MKVLNLYAGIGGNRKLWSGHDVTAVEIRPDIAKVYSHYFPDDKMIIADAHQYLLDHYHEFDFVWSSYPCQKNSRANYWASKTVDSRKKYYPGLGLYEEIIFLDHWFEGKWVLENTVPYYDQLLIKNYLPKKVGRHLFWSNFSISDFDIEEADVHKGNGAEWSKLHGFDLTDHKIDSRKDQIYRNCVHPETGLHILNCAMGKGEKDLIQQTLFQ